MANNNLKCNLSFSIISIVNEGDAKVKCDRCGGRFLLTYDGDHDHVCMEEDVLDMMYERKLAALSGNDDC